MSGTAAKEDKICQIYPEGVLLNNFKHRYMTVEIGRLRTF
jgi:hypothetical protein